MMMKKNGGRILAVLAVVFCLLSGETILAAQQKVKFKVPGIT